MLDLGRPRQGREEVQETLHGYKDPCCAVDSLSDLCCSPLSNEIQEELSNVLMAARAAAAAAAAQPAGSPGR